MLSYLETLSPLVQVLLATGFTWLVTALGAASETPTWPPSGSCSDLW